MDPLYPAILLLLALPGCWLVRSVRPVARAVAILAMGAIAVAALDLQQPVVVSRDTHAVVVATAPTHDFGHLATAPGAPGGVVEVRAAAPGRLGEELAIAAARSGPRAVERVLAWSGPPAGAPEPALTQWFDGRTTAAPLALDPSLLRMRSLGALQRDRPAAFSLALPAAAVELSLRVRFLDADGRPALDQSVPLRPREGAVIEWRPERVGVHRIECSAVVDGIVLQWTGTLEVVEPAAVAVLEDPGSSLAAALEAQGLRVVRGPEVLQRLGEWSTLVLAQQLEAATEAMVSAAVQDGLGLLLVGRALVADSALADLAPVRVLPAALPPASAGQGAAAGATGAEAAPSEPSAAPAAPPMAPPDPTREPATEVPPPPQPGEQPPVGQLPPARIVPGGPVEVDRRSIAMVLVVDRSGSMGQSDAAGETRMSYAKTAALRTAEALLEGDQVALVTFGNQDAGTLVMPLTDVMARAVVREGIAKLGAQNEATYLLDGLRIARKQLKESKAAVRHIVVISDGAVQMGEELALTALAGDLARDGSTLSLIQISGDDTSPSQRRFAELLTKAGGGTYWPVVDASRVPVLVSGEVARALDRVGRRPGGPGTGGAGTDLSQDEPSVPPSTPPEPTKPPPVPQPPKVEPADPVASAPLEVRAVSDSPLLEPRAEPWPPIGRAVAVAGREDAQTLLVVGEDGQPLLALANRGLGRVAALAVEASRENQAFHADAAFPGRLAQWVTALQRPAPRTEAGNLAVFARAEPARPTATELASLGIHGNSSLAAWVPPPAMQVADARGLAPDWALAGIALLVLVAAVEWWLVRRVP